MTITTVSNGQWLNSIEQVFHQSPQQKLTMRQGDMALVPLEAGRKMHTFGFEFRDPRPHAQLMVKVTQNNWLPGVRWGWEISVEQFFQLGRQTFQQWFGSWPNDKQLLDWAVSSGLLESQDGNAKIVNGMYMDVDISDAQGNVIYDWKKKFVDPNILSPSAEEDYVWDSIPADGIDVQPGWYMRFKPYFTSSSYSPAGSSIPLWHFKGIYQPQYAENVEIRSRNEGWYQPAQGIALPASLSGKTLVAVMLELHDNHGWSQVYLHKGDNVPITDREDIKGDRKIMGERQIFALKQPWTLQPGERIHVGGARFGRQKNEIEIREIDVYIQSAQTGTTDPRDDRGGPGDPQIQPQIHPPINPPTDPVGGRGRPGEPQIQPPIDPNRGSCPDDRVRPGQCRPPTLPMIGSIKVDNPKNHERYVRLCQGNLLAQQSDYVVVSATPNSYYGGVVRGLSNMGINVSQLEQNPAFDMRPQGLPVWISQPINNYSFKGRHLVVYEPGYADPEEMVRHIDDVFQAIQGFKQSQNNHNHETVSLPMLCTGNGADYRQVVRMLTCKALQFTGLFKWPIQTVNIVNYNPSYQNIAFQVFNQVKANYDRLSELATPSDMPGLNFQSNHIRARKKVSDDNLTYPTTKQAYAIALYTSDYYKSINTPQFISAAEPKPDLTDGDYIKLQPYYALLTCALQNMIDFGFGYVGLTYRGASFLPPYVIQGFSNTTAPFITYGFTSSTTKRGKAIGFAQGKNLFNIDALKGVDIDQHSVYPDEAEVLFPKMITRTSNVALNVGGHEREFSMNELNLVD